MPVLPMRSLLAPVALIAAAALPASAFAQDAADAEGLSHMAEQMGDPARQQEMAMMMEAMTEIMLDLPIAPMAEAMAQATGRDPGSVDPDMTLRKVAPDAGRLPRDIADNTPRAMQAMSGMARGFERMLPALRQMAEQMERTLPSARD